MTGPGFFLLRRKEIEWQIMKHQVFSLVSRLTKTTHGCFR
jgi:hypothetical protein